MITKRSAPVFALALSTCTLDAEPLGPGPEGPAGEPGTSSWVDGDEQVTTVANVGIGADSPEACLHTRGTLTEELTGEVSVSPGSSDVSGSGTDFADELAVGAAIEIAGEVFTVIAIASATELTIDSEHSAGASNAAAYTDPDALMSIDSGAGESKVTVTQAGKVGIGTAAPAATLDVAGSVQAAAWMTGGCVNPSDPNDIMVPVGDICVDKYEASVWSEPTGGTQYGASADDYPCLGNGQDCSAVETRIFARSVVGVAPSRHMTWFQASAACDNVGKHLITNAEWQRAARGTPDPGANDALPWCITDGTGPVTTGEATDCVSSFGVENMIGSLWEWTADWFVAGYDWQQEDGELATTAWPGGYGDDSTWNVDGRARNGSGTYVDGVPATARRGGSWLTGTEAGVFTVNLVSGPSGSGPEVGFRCARHR